MAIKANVRIGKSCTIALDAENPVDLIKKASQFTQLPTKCGHCESEDLKFMHRTAGNADEYDYLHLKCGDCGAQCDIGQKKAPKGDIFFKFQPKDRTNVKDGFYKYWEQDNSGNGSTGGSGGGTAAPASAEPPVYDDEGDDDIPF